MDMFRLHGKTILVTGGNGQLATSLEKLGQANVKRVGRPELDLEKPQTLKAAIEKYKPDYVVNAAAWTAVDAAETNEEQAKDANCTGPRYLAELCAERQIPFIHVSTDYVFDGEKGGPYKETDEPHPKTVYGSTKLAGEKAVLSAWERSIILRTAWVYSAHGKNFVKTMLVVGSKNPQLKVVGDQYGNPTSSDDLAKAILEIIFKIEETGWQKQYGGVFHAVGTGDATWHELAVAALQQARHHGQEMPEVLAITTEEWPTPAHRPSDSRLNTDKLQEVFGVRLPAWQESIRKIVDEYFKTV
ncbi:dTDP-4-dehydrorhamnose reductase [Entomobacter blattae]|uniref:dTDP-4-dehydrorhamnose reductase n=1 Tax=Entomobacter blattae TaxID=2762277 RepID=A0A7H1NPM6_9PROT|nr:dTDP-4-dehydrorhamnose reductase [Entomobacter blattae]QNT77736.1 dTDP-4-dehydrorhamnose reductase [Entomobacter blattae]